MAVSLVAPLGMASAALVLFGYGRCQEQRLDLPDQATVIIETGVQNTVLALAIVTLTFGDDKDSKRFFRKQLIIIFWGIIVTLEAAAVMYFFRRRILRPKNTIEEAPPVEAAGMDAAANVEMVGAGTGDIDRS